MNVTRIIEWDMGHRVPNHESKCQNLHGHRYRAEITLSGNLIRSEDLSQEGMVIDFGHIKTIAGEWIDENLDHGYMGHRELDQALLSAIESNGWRFVAVDFIPTAENISRYLFDTLTPLFEDVYGTNLQLKSIRLYETPNNYVDYDPTL